jgi:hypothetical protein
VHHLDLYVPSCFDEVTLRHTLAAREGHLHDISGRSTAVPVELDHSLKFYEAPCPEENQQGASQLLDPLQCSQLKELYQFVAYHAVKIKASLRALQHQQSVVPYNATTSIKAVMYDLSAEALRSLDRILERVAAYNRSLCGEVLTQPGGWRQFGVLNSRSNQFEFLPDLFLAPLKANLRLQESVINTQLFVSFMDEQSEEYEKLTPQRYFFFVLSTSLHHSLRGSELIYSALSWLIAYPGCSSVSGCTSGCSSARRAGGTAPGCTSTAATELFQTCNVHTFVVHTCCRISRPGGSWSQLRQFID